MATIADPAAPAAARTRVYYRHRVVTRVCHWTNALCIAFLVATGLNIFNAHPALYWGQYGANADDGRRWFEIGAVDAPGGIAGRTRIGPVTVDTSGVLGTHPTPGGGVQQQGFPDWITFPGHRDLATARRWHFFFAWGFILSGIVYLAYGFATRHLQDDVWPRRRQLGPASLWHDIVAHARLRFPRGDADREYHVLQRLAYATTVFVLLPLMVLTGLSLSPGFDAAAGGVLPQLFGGRASARSLHFIAMDLTLAFVAVHVAMVVLAGPVNQLRSMITGRYDTGGDAVMLTRRALIGAGAGGVLLSGCGKLSDSAGANAFVGMAEKATYAWQRLIGGQRLAQEFTAADISPVFKANGSTDPRDDDYRRHVDQGFADWRLKIDGLVRRPLALSLAALRALPARTQITRHDCVEGWSAIGRWSGPQLGPLLIAAGLLPSAKYIVFHCADTYGGEIGKGGAQSTGRYYESVDLADAFHPQTIVAHSLGGAPLDVAHGAPCRMRIERQLGYKHAKYVMRIEAVDSFARLELGRGGYWEDRGYEWYAGI